MNEAATFNITVGVRDLHSMHLNSHCLQVSYLERIAGKSYRRLWSIYSYVRMSRVSHAFAYLILRKPQICHFDWLWRNLWPCPQTSVLWKNVKATRRMARETERTHQGKGWVCWYHITRCLLFHYCITHQLSTHLPSVHLRSTHCARSWGFTHKCILILILQF